MRTIDLEAGLPDRETAKNRLYNGIFAARQAGAKQVKIIHGYGSSGKGGVLKAMCQTELRGYLRKKIIKAYCPGEKFGPFSEEGREIVAVYPELKKDIDWARSNDGISVVVLR